MFALSFSKCMENQNYNQQNSVLVIVTMSKVEIPLPLGPLPMVVDYKDEL
jgi:hypothetical protein